MYSIPQSGPVEGTPRGAWNLEEKVRTKLYVYFNIQSLNIMSYIQTYIRTYIHTTCISSWSVDMVFRSLETIQTLPYSALSTPLDNPLLIPALSSTHSHQRGETIDSLRHIPLFHPCCCLFRPVL